MSPPPTLPHPSTLPTLLTPENAPTLTHILDLLFEPSPTLHATGLTWFHAATPATLTAPTVYSALIGAVKTSLETLLAADDRATLDPILGAHPRLGARRVDSAQSQGEQAQLADHAEELAQLNAAYEAAFPGLRYVVFVAGRGRDEICADMRARIARGDGEAERRAGIEAMCAIALDRAGKLAQA